MRLTWQWVGVALLAACSWVVVASASAWALDVPTAPPLERPIIDQTNTLSDEQMTTLSQKIAQLRQEKSVQVAVLLIPTLEREALEQYSLKVARQWGVGEKGSNNGVLLLVAKDDRKLRIEVGRGQEGDLTDARASRIIRNTITPAFRNGDFYGGIDKGVTEIINAVQMKPEATTQPSDVDWAALITTGFSLLFVGGTWLAAVFGRSKSWWAGGVVGAGIGGFVALLASFAVWSLIGFVALIGLGLLFDFLVSRNYKKHAQKGETADWWAGGGWGGGSSSGGGGFGGGGFSGGGASGSW